MKSKLSDPGLVLSGMEAATVPLCSYVTLSSLDNQHKTKGAVTPAVPPQL